MNILRITRQVLVVALVTAAVATPVATAAPFEERYPSIADRPSVGLGTAPTVEVPSAPPQGGFDWGDAGIGAAAMLAITAIGAGAVLELGKRRRPRPTVA